MSRPLSVEREREFQELYGFVDFYLTQVQKVGDGSQPTMAEFCESIIRQHGRFKALEGLRMATNDIVEELAGVPPAEVASLDEAFRAAGFVSLSELRRRYSSSLKKVMKRGSIRVDAEYYLVNGIVVDQSNGIAAQEREALQRLLDAYELRASAKKN